MTNTTSKTAWAVAALACAAAFAVPGLASAETCYQRTQDNQTGGALLGAVAGAAIGNGVAGHHDRGAGTVLGAVIGAAVGSSVAKDGTHCGYGYSNAGYRDTRYDNRYDNSYDNSYDDRRYDDRYADTRYDNNDYDNSYNRGYVQSGSTVVYRERVVVQQQPVYRQRVVVVQQPVYSDDRYDGRDRNCHHRRHHDDDDGSW